MVAVPATVGRPDLRYYAHASVSQRCLHAELEALLNAQNHRAAADAVAPRNGFIALAGQRIHQKGRPQGAALLLRSRPPDGFQFAPLLLAQLKRAALPREGRAPLKHNPHKMYSYLENDDRVPTHTTPPRKNEAGDGGAGPRSGSGPFCPSGTWSPSPGARNRFASIPCCRV
jgi:hypothetical protein